MTVIVRSSRTAHRDVYDRRLARKVLAEFAHERMVHPISLAGNGTSDSPGTYLILSDDQSTEYVFTAEILSLDNWVIDDSSIRCLRHGVPVAVDPVTLLLDVRAGLGIGPDAVPAYLEEFVNTLGLGADRPDHLRVRAADLARADFQTIEATMTEGHPCIVANAGRIGFSANDIELYAPERAPRVALMWVAVRREHCDVATATGTDIDTLLLDELGASTLREFDAVLVARGLDPTAFRYLPVHPWQWTEKVARIHATEIAADDIVLVGTGSDLHQPQQSIRTMFNVSDPTRHYVKLALSIANMGFTRGMSADYMRTTPLINDWVRDRVGDDEYLRAVGFEILYEVAAIGYRNPVIDAITEPGSEYRKLMSALWRESPVRSLAEGDQLTTMAALLHVDHRGDTLIGEFIARSGLTAAEWIRRYLRTYLHPIAYLLYRYELKFSPHGENLILVLADGVPVRAILKDIGEEVIVQGDATGLPESCSRASVPAPDDIRNLGVLSDVFDDFLRPLAGVLHAAGLVDDREFWTLVARSVDEFVDAHPALAERFRRWDLFAPTFAAIHMNRLQLGNSRRMVDLADTYATLVDTEHQLINPIAEHARDPR